MSVSLEQAKKLFAGFATKELVGHKKAVHSLAWHPSGRKLASGSVDQTVRIWSLDTYSVGKDSLELKGHTDSVDLVTWLPNEPDKLVSASIDKTVRVWDVKNGKCIKSIPTPGENINIAASPDGKYVAVGNKEDVVTIIDMNTYKPIKETRFGYEVNEFSWSPDGKLFFVTTGRGTVEISKTLELKGLKTVDVHTGVALCIEFSPNGKYLAVGSGDALVSLWDTQEVICLRTFGRIESAIRTISFTHDSQYIATGSEDLIIDISHVESGDYVYSVPTGVAMHSLAWNPKEFLLAYAGDEKDRHLGSIKLFGNKDRL